MISFLHSRIAHFDGGDVRYWTSPDKREGAPWLVFLPGLTADHTLFDKQVVCFADKVNLLVWDVPSHGESRPFSLTWSYEDLARMLHAILQETGAVRPVLVGQSMGGYVSQVYMHLFPGEASGFVSIDSCPLQREYYAGWELWALRRTKLMLLSIPWGLLRRWVGGACATSAYGRSLMGEMLASYEKAEYCELGAHGYRGLAEVVEQGIPRDESFPTFIICGEKDRVGSAKRYNREWSRRTGIPVHWISGAGHNSNTDAPGEVNKLIESFIDTLA